MIISTALKEWAVAVEALSQGESCLLLRKGGIKESQGRFHAQASQVLLFPTFEHQKVELLKPDYQDRVQPVASGWHPPSITIKAWADITHIFLTYDAEKVAALSAFHIWQPQLAEERLKWKAKQPLYVLLLRAYRLPEPMVIPWESAYGGCRSWIELADSVSVEARPERAAIREEAYQSQVAAIQKVLSA
ncbi:MAG: DUF1802 family protein [Cyanobacteria bacterium J06581_3]